MRRLSENEAQHVAALQEFSQMGGWEVLKRVRSLDDAAHRFDRQRAANRKRMQDDIKRLVSSWPYTVVQDTTVIDRKVYVRSPVGYGREKVNPREARWEYRVYLEFNQDESPAVLDLLAHRDLIRGEDLYITSRIRITAPPTIQQRAWWFEEMTRKLPEIRARLGALEHKWRRELEIGSVPYEYESRKSRNLRKARAPQPQPEPALRPKTDPGIHMVRLRQRLRAAHAAGDTSLAASLQRSIDMLA